jgi:hypothetical protein
MAAAFIVITLTPKDFTVKDTSTGTAPKTSPKESLTRETTPVDSTETDGVGILQADYYIIVGSYRNLKQAQQKAEILRNDFNTNIIVLSTATEGYYRISYGKYSTLDEAKSVINSVRTKISSDAWIFTLNK